MCSEVISVISGEGSEDEKGEAVKVFTRGPGWESASEWKHPKLNINFTKTHSKNF